jgi:hypothetical protein
MEAVYTEEPYQPRPSPYAHIQPLPSPPQQQVVVQQRSPGVARATVWIVVTIVLAVVVLVLIALLIWLWLTRSNATALSGVGGPCTSNPCAVGLSCQSGTCAQPIALAKPGQTCTATSGCLPPAVCQFGECVLPISVTGCSSSVDCTAGSLCYDGTCMGCLGAACTASSQCLAPYTCDTTGSANGVGYCAPPAACVTDSDCGLCSAGINTASCVGGFCTTTWP